MVLIFFSPLFPVFLEMFLVLISVLHFFFFDSIGGVVLVNLSGSEKSAGKDTIGIYFFFFNPKICSDGYHILIIPSRSYSKYIFLTCITLQFGFLVSTSETGHLWYSFPPVYVGKYLHFWAFCIFLYFSYSYGCWNNLCISFIIDVWLGELNLVCITCLARLECWLCFVCFFFLSLQVPFGLL